MIYSSQTNSISSLIERTDGEYQNSTRFKFNDWKNILLSDFSSELRFIWINNIWQFYFDVFLFTYYLIVILTPRKQKNKPYLFKFLSLL
jgi:hypothetical protein